MVAADDGHDYWCKAVNNPASPLVPVNEQVSARLAVLIGVAVPEPQLVALDGLVGWEFHPGRTVEAGWAHGGRAVEGAIETRDLHHRADDDNRVRHAGFYALIDWLAGGDQQWLYAAPEQNAYYSHDHGHFFPGGPDWSPATLNYLGQTTAVSVGVDPGGLDPAELNRLADAIEGVTREGIDGVMSKIPAEWPVDDSDLEALADFVEARRPGAAQRLRGLVP